MQKQSDKIILDLKGPKEAEEEDLRPPKMTQSKSFSPSFRSRSPSTILMENVIKV